jgi:hypothetical protein
MTGLTGDQVREVQWASSEKGEAQLQAAWAVAVRFGLYDRGVTVTMADVSAMLWAAHEAAVPDNGPPPAQRAGIVTVLAGCTYCRRLIARPEDGGEWRTLPDTVTGAGSVRFPAAAFACSASPDDRHHPPGPGGNTGALRHLGAM